MMNTALMAGLLSQGSQRRVSIQPPPPDAPVLTIATGIVVFGDRTNEGTLIEGIGIPWFAILARFRLNPQAMFEPTPREWEEIIAAAYKAAGYDEMILTPRSGDGGKDVIATKNGVGSIRIYDQVKAYRPGHLVTADEVRSLGGVLLGNPNVTKGVVTTTSEFAPRLMDDPGLAALIPYRLELKPGTVLLPWLNAMSEKSGHPPG